MRHLALLSAAAAAFVGLAACAGTDRAPVEACADRPSAPPEKPTAAPQEPLLGLLMLPDTAIILARLDPLSLKPVSRRVEVGEYHDAWSVSPDGSQLALGISSGGSLISPSRRLHKRIGILIVDLEEMKVVGEVETGSAATALGWLAPRRLAAALTLAFGPGGPSGGTLLVDPFTATVLHRRPGSSEPRVSARTGDGLAVLFPERSSTGGGAPARLVVVDVHGRLRSVVLERIRISAEDARDAGLALDPARERAYVFVADAPVAEVDLRTMHTSYHRLEPLFLRPGELAGLESSSPLRDRQRQAIWLGHGQVAVFGRDLVAGSGGQTTAIPAGVTLIDTHTWRSCVLDPKASGAAFIAGRLLVYGPGSPVSRHLRGMGLRAYTIEGREAFQLFDTEHVWDVQAAAHLAYVRTRRAVHVVDVKSGKVISEIVPPPELIDVVIEPS